VGLDQIDFERALVRVEIVAHALQVFFLRGVRQLVGAFRAQPPSHHYVEAFEPAGRAVGRPEHGVDVPAVSSLDAQVRQNPGHKFGQAAQVVLRPFAASALFIR
jgi:hypothetical protein